MYTNILSIRAIIAEMGCIVLIVWAWSHPMFWALNVNAVLFHEMGHAGAAVATGGEVLQITLTANEGGYCSTQGGNCGFIVLMGYCTEALAGIFLVIACTRKSRALLMLILLIGASMYAGWNWKLSDLAYKILLLSIAGAIVLTSLSCLSWRFGSILIRFVGTYWCIYALYDMFSDCMIGKSVTTADGTFIRNDAESFSVLSGLPSEMVSVLIFFTIFCASLAVLYLSVRIRMKYQEKAIVAV